MATIADFFLTLEEPTIFDMFDNATEEGDTHDIALVIINTLGQSYVVRAWFYKYVLTYVCWLDDDNFLEVHESTRSALFHLYCAYSLDMSEFERELRLACYDELKVALKEAKTDCYTCDDCGGDIRSGLHGVQRDADDWYCVPDSDDDYFSYDEAKDRRDELNY